MKIKRNLKNNSLRMQINSNERKEFKILKSKLNVKRKEFHWIKNDEQ